MDNQEQRAMEYCDNKDLNGLISSSTVFKLMAEFAQQELQHYKESQQSALEELLDFMHDGTTGSDQMVNLPLNYDDIYKRLLNF